MEEILAAARQEYEQTYPQPVILGSQGHLGTLLRQLEWINWHHFFEQKTVDCLLVGPSTKSYFVGRRSYEIYELLAYFQKHMIKQGIVDALDAHPQAFSNMHQQALYLCHWDNTDIDLFQEGWQRLIDALNPPYATPTKLGSEYHVMGLPEIFKKRVAEVHGVIGDVVTTPLPLRGTPYDFIICRNVLWQLPPSGMLAAIHNFSQAMKPEALLLVGGGIGLNEEIRRPDIYPTLSQEWLDFLGLHYIDGSSEMLLQKNRE